MPLGIRPYELSDQVIDFSSGLPHFQVLMQVNELQFAFQYRLVRSGGAYHSPMQKITTNGTPLTSGAYTYQLPVGQTDATTFVRRNTPVAGVYIDNIQWWENLTVYDPQTNDDTNTGGTTTDPGTSFTKPAIVGADEWSYYVFQKSIAALTVDGTIVTPGASFTKAINTNILLSSLAYGRENGYTFIIQVQNADGSWRAAVNSVDYTITSGPSFTGDDTIQLTQTAAYRFTLKVDGYTTLSNPFNPIVGNTTRSIVSENTDSITFTVNTGAAAITEAIKFPKITTVATPADIVSSSPLTTYQNSAINVVGTLQYVTGEWIVNGVARTNVTDAEWDAEMLAKCKVRLHVKNSSGVDVLAPLEGLGPHSIRLPQPGSYNINYLTSLI